MFCMQRYVISVCACDTSFTPHTPEAATAIVRTEYRNNASQFQRPPHSSSKWLALHCIDKMAFVHFHLHSEPNRRNSRRVAIPIMDTTSIEARNLYISRIAPHTHTHMHANSVSFSSPISSQFLEICYHSSQHRNRDRLPWCGAYTHSKPMTFLFENSSSSAHFHMQCGFRHTAYI